MAAPGVLTASMASATLAARDAAAAVLSASTGAGTAGGYPAVYGPRYPASQGALILTSSTAP